MAPFSPTSTAFTAQLKPQDPVSPLSYRRQLLPGAHFQLHRQGSEVHQHRHCQSLIHMGRKRGRIYKLMSHIPHLGSDGVPVGTHFLMASLQPLLHMPLQNASSSAPTLLASLTQPNTSQTFHGCPKALPCSDSLSKILPVFPCKFPIPPLLSQLLPSRILLLTAQWFSGSCITRTSLSPLPSFLSHFSIYDSRPPASKSFPSLLSLQAPSSFLHQLPDSVTLFCTDPVPISFLLLPVLIHVCPSYPSCYPIYF